MIQNDYYHLNGILVVHGSWYILMGYQWFMVHDTK